MHYFLLYTYNWYNTESSVNFTEQSNEKVNKYFNYILNLIKEPEYPDILKGSVSNVFPDSWMFSKKFCHKFQIVIKKVLNSIDPFFKHINYMGRLRLNVFQKIIHLT